MLFTGPEMVKFKMNLFCIQLNFLYSELAKVKEKDMLIGEQSEIYKNDVNKKSINSIKKASFII